MESVQMNEPQVGELGRDGALGGIPAEHAPPGGPQATVVLARRPASQATRVDVHVGNERVERRPVGGATASRPDATVIISAAPGLPEAPAPDHLTLRGRDRLLIGRLPTNDVVLDHPAVSRFHARITPVEGGYALEDLESAN